MGRDEVIVVDTHVAIWITAGSPSLGKQSRAALELAFKEDRVAVSAITFWEMAMLIEKQRLGVISSAAELRTKILGAQIEEVPVDGNIAILAAGLEHLHGDPADRLIVATALAHDAMLMTADRAILRWRNKLQRLNAAK